MTTPAASLTRPLAGGISRKTRVPRYSELRHRLFLLYLYRFFSRNFHAVRTSGELPAVDGPVIFYANHPGWWDPIHFLLLGRLVLPQRRVYGPMEAAALERYGFFKKLGVFGVESTPRGAAKFLRMSRSILELPRASLWLTAEGRFTDPRRRPVVLRPGLAHLVRRIGPTTVIPLAVEYPFWNEREPEALSRFGIPILVTGDEGRSAESWNLFLEARLSETMDRLSANAQTREPGRFRTLLAGRAGVGGIYDGWRRLLATLRGRPFQAGHGDDA